MSSNAWQKDGKLTRNALRLALQILSSQFSVRLATLWPPTMEALLGACGAAAPKRKKRRMAKPQPCFGAVLAPF